MRKAVSLLMAATMTLGLAACGSSASTGSESSAATSTSSASSETSAEAATAAAGQSYTVGICQLVQHDALDAATQGFKDALTEKLGGQCTV